MSVEFFGSSGKTHMPAEDGKIARCTEAVLFAGFITMFVLGILGTQGIVPMAPGGAYAMIVLGSLAILALIRSCCGGASNASQQTTLEN